MPVFSIDLYYKTLLKYITKTLHLNKLNLNLINYSVNILNFLNTLDGTRKNCYTVNNIAIITNLHIH